MNEKKAKRIRKKCIRASRFLKEPMRRYEWLNVKGGTIIISPNCTRGRIRAAKKLLAQKRQS